MYKAFYSPLRGVFTYRYTTERILYKSNSIMSCRHTISVIAALYQTAYL